jgi:AcrR family transcriptional regulator
MQYDIHHMKRATTRSKEATHDRIVDAAARAIRRSGYNGTGVADIMKDAGLTHGGFYAHFPSREAMLAEAADRAGSESVAMMERIVASSPPQQALPAMIRAYLSKEHLEGIETGCATAALGSEMPRQAREVRRAATRRIKEMIDLNARLGADGRTRARPLHRRDDGWRAGAGACRRRAQTFRWAAQGSAEASRSDSGLTPLGTRVYALDLEYDMHHICRMTSPLRLKVLP